MTSERYTTYHFSQGNPVGPDFWDVPALLRRVADSIESDPAMRVDDLTFTSTHDELALTVYYHLADEDDG